MKESVGKYIE
jgi:hypothetical protein